MAAWADNVGRSKTLFWILSLVLFVFGSQATGETKTADAFAVIKDFGRALYVTAERTGGSVEEWDLLEEQAATAMIVALEAAATTAPMLDEKGATPLHLASSNGYLFLVTLILDNDVSGPWLNLRDQDGLTPYERAMLAFPETLMACHPETENPFALIPFTVKSPYYADRQPFEEIQNQLVQKGALKNTENARRLWLAKCSNQNALARGNVETAEDLYGALTTISVTVDRERRKQALEKNVEFLIELTNLMPASKRSTPEVLQEQIREMYRKEGFEPPD